MAQKIRTRFAGTAVFGAVVVILGLWLASCSPKGIDSFTEVGREPNVSPDYAGTVIPANIAPLNFRILEDGRAYFVTVRGDRGRSDPHLQPNGTDSHPCCVRGVPCSTPTGVRASSSMSTSRAPIASGGGSSPSSIPSPRRTLTAPWSFGS